MKIGEVSKKLNISITALRYYDKIGLVSPVKNGYSRDYSERDLERLYFVDVFQKAFFSLDNIKMLFLLDDKYKSLEEIENMDPDDLKDLKELIVSNSNEIDEKIKNLKEAKMLLDAMEKKLKTLEK